MIYKVKEGKLHTDNTEMDYITFGKVTKPLILVQGLNILFIKGLGHLLAYKYRLFAKNYTVYLFDRRANVYEGITVRDMAGDLAQAMDMLNITKADILGVYMGGMIAQYLAIDRPDLVRKLILVVTLAKNNDMVRSVIENWIQMAEQNEMKKLIADMAERIYSDTYLRRYRFLMPLLTFLQKTNDLKRFAILTKACLTCNSYDELNKIKCPVFVIGGRKDQIVSGRASEEIAEKLDCKLWMYDDLGHAAYDEAKDFNQRVYTFLKD